MTKKLATLSLAVAIAMLGGCASSSQPHYIDKEKVGTSTPTTMGLDYEDFERASLKLVNSMLKSRYLERMYQVKMKKEGKPLILMISDFINDTTQRIDIDQLVKKFAYLCLTAAVLS